MIKLIAFDMDGTFMPQKGNYNRERFLRDYKLLKEKGIKLMPLSGDQYDQIISFFPEEKNELIVGSLNGSLVYERGNLIHADFLDGGLVLELMEAIIQNNLAPYTMLCGEKFCYFLKNADTIFRKRMNFYFSKNVDVEGFVPLPKDNFVEFVLAPQDSIEEVIKLLNNVSRGRVKVFNSGVNSVDIFNKEVNKGNSLKWFAEKENIKPSEIMVFGDGRNDIEMLEFTENSYAMKNARKEVKERAKFVTDLPNNEDGVLDMIEKTILK